MKKISLFLAVGFIIAPTNLAAQVDLSYYLPQGISYDRSVPTPQSVLGHEIGEWHVSHDKLVNYMVAVAEASDRVTLSEYGRTYENRPLLLLVVTSPQNHQRIDAIRAEHLQLTELNSDAVDIDAQPAVVWLGHSVQGNEASGSKSS